MADDKTTQDNSGTEFTLATDQIAGVDYPRGKLIHGADGVNDGDVSTTNPLPIQLRLADGTVIAKSEDAAHTTGDPGFQILAVRNDTLAALAGTDGDYAPVQVDANGALYVNVNAFTPGTAAGSLGKAEDAQHSSGDTGVMSLAVRNDTLAALAGTDGDYAPFQVDANGAVYVNVNALSPGTSAGSLGKAEDAQHTSGDTGVMSLVVRNDSLAALAGTDGDYAPLQVDANGALYVAVNSQPARAVGTDSIGAYPQTDAIYDGTTALTPKFAVIDDATSGDNTIIAAVSGKKLRVLAYTIIAAGDVTARFESGAGGTALTGQMSLTTNSGASPPYCPAGHFETAAGQALNLELSAAISVDGHITYVEV